MLGVKERMNRGECDVLITAAIATDKMRAEKLVVISLLTRFEGEAGGSNTTGRLTTNHIGTRVDHIIRIRRLVRLDPNTLEGTRIRRVGYVEKEAMADAQRLARIDRIFKIAFDELGLSIREHSDDELGKTALRAGDEFAVGIGGEHRNARAIKIVEQNAQFCSCLKLSGIPGRHTAVIRGVEYSVIAETIEQAPGGLNTFVVSRSRRAICRASSEFVFAN